MLFSTYALKSAWLMVKIPIGEILVFINKFQAMHPNALMKLTNIACQTLLFVSVSLVKDNNVLADL